MCYIMVQILYDSNVKRLLNCATVSVLLYGAMLTKVKHFHLLCQ